MFTDKAQAVVDRAKDFAFSSGAAELGIDAVLAALSRSAEGAVLLAECAGTTPEKVKAACPRLPEPATCPGKLPLAFPLRALLSCAGDLAADIPDRLYPGLIDLRHLVGALATSPEACALLGVAPVERADAVIALASWHEKDSQTPGLDELTERLRTLRSDLLAKVYGQDHAVHAFVEGLFNAEVVAAADAERASPRAVFVFAGPAGVGKTLLAELGASRLARPFRRFDMSAYSDHYQSEALIGMAKSFKGAHPGTLTEFVEKNPDAVLLFDEIEKAHATTIHLFLQVLDSGKLEDKYNEREVAFRETTIIFTTNAGKKLYDRPNTTGVHRAMAAFHRRTILDALEHEKDPRTDEPFFPQAICSRMAAGYPVLFNHLTVNDLVRVVDAELGRVAGLFERQYYKSMAFDEILPVCLVLREGAKSDARTLCSQAETFAKTEVFKFCQLFKTERLEDALERVDGIRFAVDWQGGEASAAEAEARALFEGAEKPRVLMIAADELTALYRERIDEVEWLAARPASEALSVLANEEADMVLLDLWLGRQPGGLAGLGGPEGTATMRHFDHVPAAARGLGPGQELLRRIRERLPAMPVYLLSLAGPGGPAGGDSEEKPEGSIDGELLMACVRGGGARGMIVSRFVPPLARGWEEHRDRFTRELVGTCRRLYRERAAERMGQERKVLAFDTAPRISPAEREIVVRIRNLSLARAVAAADAGEILDDVERPRVSFDEVVGANTAKEELGFFIDYLRNPRRFAALGLKPPKGVLLYGPPGTGKTMLARAMAGESDVAFVPASASGFVTVWQGSGPQNVRDLFERARRYAPAIVFIDEIDAIGTVRSGGPGGGRAEEMALNALLTEMDGFTSPSPDRPVFILAATNFGIRSEDPDSPQRSARTLDPALVRRFSRTILVDLPDTEARKAYLTRRLVREPGDGARREAAGETVALLAEGSAGMSIADLEAVIETAARRSAKEGGAVTGEELGLILVEALDTAREGEVKKWSPELLEGTAVHEAGHTVMYWLSGWWPTEVSIIARGEHGGGMRRSEAEVGRESVTRDELLARVRTLLGGRAAEVITYGPEAGLTTGASGDLEAATGLARDMICRFGMDEEFGLLATPEVLRAREAVGSPLYERVNEVAGRILTEQMERTLGLLKENRARLDAVAGALLRRNRLLRKDLQEVLPPLPSREGRRTTRLMGRASAEDDAPPG